MEVFEIKVFKCIHKQKHVHIFFNIYRFPFNDYIECLGIRMLGTFECVVRILDTDILNCIVQLQYY